MGSDNQMISLSTNNPWARESYLCIYIWIMTHYYPGMEHTGQPFSCPQMTAQKRNPPPEGKILRCKAVFHFDWKK